MRKVTLGLFCCLLAAVAAFVSVVQQKPYYESVLYKQGDLLLPRAEDLTEIRLQTDESDVLLQKINGVWMADGYYASQTFVEDFLRRLQQAAVKEKLPFVSGNGSEMLMVFKDGSRLKMFLQADDKTDKSIAVLNGAAYLTDQNLQPSAALADYYLQPLLPLDGDSIERVVNYAGDYEFLLSLSSRGAVRNLPEDAVCRRFEIVSAAGLKLICGLCQTKRLYLLGVDLQTTVMPTKAAAAFAAENRFRFDGWYFVLKAEDGAKLFAAVTE